MARTADERLPNPTRRDWGTFGSLCYEYYCKHWAVLIASISPPTRAARLPRVVISRRYHIPIHVNSFRQPADRGAVLLPNVCVTVGLRYDVRSSTSVRDSEAIALIGSSHKNGYLCNGRWLRTSIKKKKQPRTHALNFLTASSSSLSSSSCGCCSSPNHRHRDSISFGAVQKRRYDEHQVRCSVHAFLYKCK